MRRETERERERVYYRRRMQAPPKFHPANVDLMWLAKKFRIIARTTREIYMHDARVYKYNVC